MARVKNYLARYRSPVETAEVGIGAFTALVRTRETTKLTAESPDTPVEDGSYVHDHVILKPVTLTIEGDVSDVHLRASPVVRQFQRLQAEIGNLTSQYAPPRTQAQLGKISALANDAADAVRGLDALLDSGEQAVNYFGNRDTTSKSIRELFLDAMEGYYYAGEPISITMPHGRLHTNMVITSLTINTDNIHDSVTFVLDVKQLRSTESPTVTVAPAPAGGLGGQADAAADKGTQAGTKQLESFAAEILDAYRGITQ